MLDSLMLYSLLVDFVNVLYFWRIFSLRLILVINPIFLELIVGAFVDQSSELLDFILFHWSKCMNSYITYMNIVIMTMGN